MDWEWLTADTGPWWATAVASIGTFVLGNLISNRANERQRAAEEGSASAEREHARQLAQMQHEADQTKYRFDQEHEAAESVALASRKEARSERDADEAALTEGINAIGALRAAVTMSARQYGHERLNAVPVPPEVLSRFVVAMSICLRREIGDLSDDEVEGTLGNIEKYVADWAGLDQIQREAYAGRIAHDLGKHTQNIVYA